MKKYMIVERFKDGFFDEVYSRYNLKGRMLPDGLYYLNSWVNREKNICFQLMETNDSSLFDSWIKNWSDLTEFEVIEIDN